MSNVQTISAHPAYQEIIAMGEPVVPLILRHMKENGPYHWFVALTTITGENPITKEIAGYMVKMTEVWLKWGRDKGLID